MTVAIDPALIDRAQEMYSTGQHTLAEVATALSLNYWTMRRHLKKREVQTNLRVAYDRVAEAKTKTVCTACANCGAPPKVGTRYCEKCGADRSRWRHIHRTYGLTPDAYRALLLKQGGGCALCGLPPSGKYALRVDHDHDTGRVRGLLCNTCNISLGHLGDSAIGLRRALVYVEGS